MELATPLYSTWKGKPTAGDGTRLESGRAKALGVRSPPLPPHTKTIMTTPSERKFIYELYLELQKRIERNREVMDSNHQSIHFGVWDDDEEARLRRQSDSNYDTAKGSLGACQEIWSFVKSKYSEWDIQLALQENQQRIGSIPFAG